MPSHLRIIKGGTEPHSGDAGQAFRPPDLRLIQGGAEFPEKKSLNFIWRAVFRFQITRLIDGPWLPLFDRKNNGVLNSYKIFQERYPALAAHIGESGFNLLLNAVEGYRTNTDDVLRQLNL